MTTRYEIKCVSSVADDMRRVGKTFMSKVVDAVYRLSENPLGADTRQLKNGLYRLRAQDYRLVYSIRDTTVTLYAVKFGHRRKENI